MHSRLRTQVAAFVGAAFFGVMLASCSGGTSSIPQAPQQSQSAPTATAPPANNAVTQNPTAMSIISIKNSDRSAVASVGAIHVHYFAVKKPGMSRITTQSVVHTSNLENFQGPTLPNAQVYNAYVDSSPSTFGSVADFEQRLSRSTMIHMTDEYVGATTNNRYDWKGDVGVNYPAYTTLGDNDLLLIIHAVAAGVAGGGLKHIYHIFLPPGLNYCASGTLLPVGYCSASATSPNPAFCGFHGAVAFPDITGATLFTVEPYVDTDFCNVDAFSANPTAPTPNGIQKDSTYSVVSHEEFETITDPIPGSGWVNPNPFYPAEIGDLCAYVNGQFDSNGFVVPEDTKLYGKLFRIQFEYSNKQIGCNNTTP